MGSEVTGLGGPSEQAIVQKTRDMNKEHMNMEALADLSNSGIFKRNDLWSSDLVQAG